MRIEASSGGGIRGVIGAIVKARLHAACPESAKPDLYAGTSTGAILAAAGACGLDPLHVVKLYEERGRDIFARSTWWSVKTGGGTLGPKYPNDGLRGVLRDVFGDRRLGEVPARIALTAYRLDSESENPGQAPRTDGPVVMHNYPGSKYLDLKLVDALVRSSAAAPFFPSHQGHIDGGYWANNPVLAACAVAVHEVGGDPRSIKLLSIGTGEIPGYYPGSPAWGLAGVAKPALSILFDGASQSAEWIASALIPPGQYVEVNPILPRDIPLDDWSAVGELEKIASDVDIAPALSLLRSW